MSDVTDIYSDFPGDYWKAAELDGHKAQAAHDHDGRKGGDE